MDKQKREYFFTALDQHLRKGNSPAVALQKAVKDYAFVWHTDDGRLPIGRASELALKELREGQEGELRDADGYIVELRRTRRKLTPDQLFEISKRYAAGDVTQAEIAAEYGVDESTICRIIQAFPKNDG